MLVAAVWATIGFKIISALNPELPEVKQQDFIAKLDYKVNTAIDTFSIATQNRDPFLGALFKNEPKKTAIKKRRDVEWKNITYQGIIKSGKSKHQIFIVNIDDVQYLLKKGQIKDSVTLVYGNSRYVKVRYKNQSKRYKLKK